MSAPAGSISNGIAVMVSRSPRAVSMPMAFRTAASSPAIGVVPRAFWSISTATLSRLMLPTEPMMRSTFFEFW